MGLVHYIKVDGFDTFRIACEPPQQAAFMHRTQGTEVASRETFARLAMVDGTRRLCPKCYKINVNEQAADGTLNLKAPQ
jgi:hypothetical protein